MHALSTIIQNWCGAMLCASAAALSPTPLSLSVVPPAQPALARPPAASARALDNARGGTDTISNEARLSGIVSGNTASHVVTGANVIQSNSFANATGIAVVIQNSGANVLIQNATVINLQLK